jgi:hypothetical protein
MFASVWITELRARAAIRLEQQHLLQQQNDLYTGIHLALD